jgi:hypothetical protein
MDYKDKLLQTLQNLTQQKDTISKDLEKLEEEFANVKLNPYGITSMDFSKRQELSTDVLKIEGSIMGITLALDLYDEATESVTA